MELTNPNNDTGRKKTRQTWAPSDYGSVYGKIPPQAKDIEEAILGAIMLAPGTLDQAAGLLRPEMFYAESHQLIFRAMLQMSARQEPIDLLTVTDQLRKSGELDGCGGSYYLTRLTNSVVSNAHIEYHCRIVLQKFIQREIIRVCGEMIKSAYDEASDAFDLIEELEQSVDQLNSNFNFGDMIPIDTVLVEAIREIELNRSRDTSVTGVPSGFDELDRATRGWQNGNLIILAARPSVGKTAFAIRLARNAGQAFMQLNKADPSFKKRVAVFSLEMKSVKLVLRMLAAEAEELLYRIQVGRLDSSQMNNLYTRGVQMLARLGISFDDNPSLTMPKLKAKCRKMARKGELGLIIVDYLQLIVPMNKKQTREQQVSEISRELKLLAEELNVPIIALSQMSRAIEQRSAKEGGRVPQLSDLRESGSIEQDADLVMFLWGPEDFEILQDASLKERRYLRIAKQRDGFLMTMDLDFKDEIQQFQQANLIPELGQGAWRPISQIEAKKKSFYEPDDSMPF